MILELNASDDRGIDIVKQEIKNFAGTRTIFGYASVLLHEFFASIKAFDSQGDGRSGYKMIVLDEADNMTSAAQFALRRGEGTHAVIFPTLQFLTLLWWTVIENYTSNARFCLICNYVNKIIPALQVPARAKPLCNPGSDKIISVADDALKAMEKLSGGDMRKCLNIMQVLPLCWRLCASTVCCYCMLAVSSHVSFPPLDVVLSPLPPSAPFYPSAPNLCALSLSLPPRVSLIARSLSLLG
eukprot:1011616-Rhodomonas_salina.1